MRARWIVALIGAAVLADQLTKATALALLSRGEVVPVLNPELEDNANWIKRNPVKTRQAKLQRQKDKS